MLDELMRLLEEIEDATLGKEPMVRDLIKAVNQNNVVVERRKILEDAFKNDCIEDVSLNKEFNDDIKCRLKIAGIDLLNRLRMRKATELIAKSSKRLEYLTTVLIVSTIVLIILTAVLVGDILVRYFIK
jgi:hypothetical protein